METITVQISGAIYHIGTVDELTEVQNILTKKFFEQCQNEAEVVDRYFRETSHLEIYDRVSDYPDLMDDIVDKAVEIETDYQTLDEAVDALRGMEEALNNIYDYTRDWV